MKKAYLVKSFPFKLAEMYNLPYGECAGGVCNQCHYNEGDQLWVRCIPPEPCVDEGGVMEELTCLTCSDADTDEECRSTGTYQTCNDEVHTTKELWHCYVSVQKRH